MRYILDSEGYIHSASCSHIECDTTGTEYTGAVPEGYDSLEIWATTANIRAYKIVDGQLVYDANRAAALEAEWNQCESLLDALFYKSGDTYKTTQQAIYTGGTVTGGTKSLNFTITVPKSLKNITNVTIKNMTLLIRTTAGAYLNNASGGIKYGSTSGITYNLFITSDNTILIQLVSSAAYTNVTNNTPVNVAISSFEISFN